MARRPPRLQHDTRSGETLDHYVSGSVWQVPPTVRVEQVGSEGIPMLVWSGEPPFLEVRPGPGLFEDFLKLETAKDRGAVLRYARRWGPLWLCSHDLPAGHDDACLPIGAIRYLTDDRARRMVWWEEEIDRWRAMSREAAGVVRIARQLHDGRLARQADWESLRYLPRVLWNLLLAPSGIRLLDPEGRASEEQVVQRLERLLNAEVVAPDESDEVDDDIEPATARRRRIVEEYGVRRLQDSLETQRVVLSGLITYWLRIADVQPRLDWQRGKPEVVLSGRGLFAALAVQLLFECSRTDGLAVCTSCGTPFLPAARRPRRDHNAYCSDCGLKAAQRDAAARYRQTQKYRATYDTWLKKRRNSST